MENMTISQKLIIVLLATILCFNYMKKATIKDRKVAERPETPRDVAELPGVGGVPVAPSSPVGGGGAVAEDGGVAADGEGEEEDGGVAVELPVTLMASF